MHENATARLAAETDAPLDRGVRDLDVRTLGPPKPLRETLETLPDLSGEVLVQHNDRVPQHLYPRLDDRGYAYATVETEDVVLTAIWEP